MNRGRRHFRRKGALSSAGIVWLGSLVAVAVLVAMLMRRAPEGGGTPLMVYCAAGLKVPVEAVARQFEAGTGMRVELQFGGSGTLLTNLRAAGRGDLFVAADESYIGKARELGLVGESVAVATQQPVIAVRRGNVKGMREIADLMRIDVRVALANPEAASIGSVTKRVLTASGEWSALEKHATVFKPTVQDVANDVKLGAVDAGIVWDATVAQYAELEMVRVAALDGVREKVTAGVLKASRQPEAALRFARYLGARDAGLAEFTKRGYGGVE